MSDSVRDWLPEQGAPSAVGERALAGAVDAWARDWFAAEQMRMLGTLMPASASRSELRKVEWQRRREGIALGLPPGAEIGLGALALDVAVGGERTQADREMLEAVGRACLDALKARLAALPGLGRPERWLPGGIPAGGRRIELGTPMRTLVFTLEVSGDLLVRLTKAGLPESGEARLGDPSEALAGLAVRVSATAGQCALTVAELSSLSPGDVIVLDRDLDDALPLLLQDRPLWRGACVLADHGGMAALKIVQAPIG